MSFYTMAGPMALGSRLRQLADVITSDAEKVFQLYEVNLNPRWFPVFYMLTQKGEASISQMASDIGQTHAAVSQVVAAMEKAGLVQVRRSEGDARVSVVDISEQGKLISNQLAQQCEDVGAAISQMLSESESVLWEELNVLERQLSKKSVFERVREVRTRKLVQALTFVPYGVHHHKAFKTLNEKWIKQNFTMEDSDYAALDHPQTHILDKGGYIVMADLNGKSVGTCALIKMNDNDFELAKMAVDDSVKGLGIGFMLGEHVMDKAKSLGAKRLYLESNTKLVPAINLYQKLGFKRIAHQPSPYARCNIQMELIL